MSTILMSPRGVMILVPLLVLVLGAALTFIGQLALGVTSRTMARDRLVAQATSVAFGLDNTLSQAEPLLDELSRIARGPRTETDGTFDEVRIGVVALELRDLMIGRAGVTELYVAYPDGLFLAADPSAKDGVRINVVRGGTSHSFAIEGAQVRQVETRSSSFDPRVRDWYKLAALKKERTWTRPYSFFQTYKTGATRAEPVFDASEPQRLAAVVGVDFDVDALTAFMARGEMADDDVNAVVFTGKGVVLAYPKAAARLREIQGEKKVVSHSALGDPTVTALVQRVSAMPEVVRPGGHFTLRVGDGNVLASVRHVGSGGPDWYVATFAPERSVLRDLYSHRMSSLVVGTLFLLIAASLAWFLARRLHRISREAELAQDAAAIAQSQVRDLGSYRLVSRLGEGGMGEVWRASHRLLARQAAIKLIKPGSTDARRGREQKERFRREAQAIAGLRSHNTVALFDYGITPDGTLFYVMELLDGIDLNTLVNEHGPQPADRVVRILVQACNSLVEAHEAGLVHRDIKPANLFLCREADEVDVVKVLDFGLVSQVAALPQADLVGPDDHVEPDLALRTTLAPGTKKGAPKEEKKRAPNVDIILVDMTEKEGAPGNDVRITQVEHQLGTPAFMSPEQALGMPTDGRSDLYSLACVAFFLLTGRPPFSAETPLRVMVKQVEEAPPKLYDVMKTPVSAAFAELIESCLEKSALDRPQTAHDLRDKLRALASEEPLFSDEQARAWWRAHRPAPENAMDRRSVQLRDVEMIPPTP